jgi:hypothetical protein
MMAMPRYATLQLRNEAGQVKGWAIVEVGDETPAPASPSADAATKPTRSFATRREALASLRAMLEDGDAG